MNRCLDEQGEMLKEPLEVKEMGEYLASIIVMTTYPAPECPPEYKVYCKQWPSCLEEIVSCVDPESNTIVWKCLKCSERGRISNWQGTIWDMTDIGKVH